MLTNSTDVISCRFFNNFVQCWLLFTVDYKSLQKNWEALLKLYSGSQTQFLQLTFSDGIYVRKANRDVQVSTFHNLASLELCMTFNSW